MEDQHLVGRQGERKGNRERRLKKISLGICVRCTNPAVVGGLTCEKCREDYRSRTNSRRKMLIASKTCTACGSSAAVFGYFCKECYDKQGDYRDRLMAKKEDKKICLVCSEERVFGKSFCQKHLDKMRDERKTLRNEVVKEYGGRCACCGESVAKFLTIDHIHNDGNNHRKSLNMKRTGSNPFYKWLKRNGFPKDRFQLLCYNCNLGKATNGGVCPHHDN